MHNNSFFFKYKLHHLLCWILLFGIWYFFRYQDFSTGSKVFQVTLVKVIDLALMIYMTNYLLIPFLLYRKRYLLFAAIFILMVFAGSILKMKILGQITNSPAFLIMAGNMKGRIYDNVIPHFFLVIAGAAFKLVKDHLKMQQQMVEVIKEKSAAELNFLRSQMNPHFLFNSLNSVYFLINKTNPEARQALHKFSDMLRYQLYEMDGDLIPVEKEINYLQDYVDLQKLRKDEHYEVVFECSAEGKGFFIQPLLLVPFVENAFKHISHYHNKINFVNIRLDIVENMLCFVVTNSKDRSDKTTEQPGGIGLTNVKRRLVLLYPGKHQLQVTDEDEQFSVNLNISI